jgi:hypothetical protein
MMPASTIFLRKVKVPRMIYPDLVGMAKNTFAFSGLSICAGYGTCIGEVDTMITGCSWS